MNWAFIIYLSFIEGVINAASLYEEFIGQYAIIGGIVEPAVIVYQSISHISVKCLLKICKQQWQEPYYWEKDHFTPRIFNTHNIS